MVADLVIALDRLPVLRHALKRLSDGEPRLGSLVPLRPLQHLFQIGDGLRILPLFQQDGTDFQLDVIGTGVLGVLPQQPQSGPMRLVVLVGFLIAPQQHPDGTSPLLQGHGTL